MKNLPTLKLTLVGLLATIALFGMSGCGSSTSSEDTGQKGTMEVEATLTKVERADIQRTVTISGTVAALPNQDVKVSALVPGRIARLPVAEGDAVKIGQLLAKIDDRTYRDQVQQAEAAEAQAKANLQNAQLSLKRNQDLFDRGIAARKDLEDARTQQQVAQATLRQAEAALEIAHMQLSRTEVLSPLTGRVAKRFVNIGEQVDGTAAQPIVEVANLGQAELQGNLPAFYLSRIKVGQTVPVTSDALPGMTLSGKVIAISPAVDPATNVGLIRIRIPNKEHLLRLGIFLNAPIAVETHAHALTVPPQAVYRDENGKPRVFEIENNTSKPVEVTLGIETPDRIELLSGAKEGDTVILTGGYGLQGGEKIKTKP
ncbi:MAG: efflux RND transporter periplasmic adaptor subunit [Candidatus Acidiferrales bacterium]